MLGTSFSAIPWACYGQAEKTLSFSSPIIPCKLSGFGRVASPAAMPVVGESSVKIGICLCALGYGCALPRPCKMSLGKGTTPREKSRLCHEEGEMDAGLKVIDGHWNCIENIIISCLRVASPLPPLGSPCKTYSLN